MSQPHFEPKELTVGFVGRFWITKKIYADPRSALHLEQFFPSFVGSTRAFMLTQDVVNACQCMSMHVNAWMHISLMFFERVTGGTLMEFR